MAFKNPTRGTRLVPSPKTIVSLLKSNIEAKVSDGMGQLLVETVKTRNIYDNFIRCFRIEKFVKCPTKLLLLGLKLYD